MKNIDYPVSSKLPSEDLPAPGVIRAPRGANPVNAGENGNRETRPLLIQANARTKHPKLNTQSWTTEYAQSRSEPKLARPKARRSYSKRDKGKTK